MILAEMSVYEMPVETENVINPQSFGVRSSNFQGLLVLMMSKFYEIFKKIAEVVVSRFKSFGCDSNYIFFSSFFILI